MLQNSNIKMAENKNEIQTDTEDVAQFFFFQFTKEELPLLHSKWNGAWNRAFASAFSC